MRSLLYYQTRLLPDFIPMMQRRYMILHHIRLMQPIGRRNLAVNLDMTERVLRGEVTFLKEQDLIHIAPSGMTLTNEGEELLNALAGFMKEISGLKVLEERLKEILNLEEVVVVSGDSDETVWVKQEMGRACVECINRRISAQDIVAVTGGTTLAAVASNMKPDFKSLDLLFVPARGGLNESVEKQANTICANMAKQAGAEYRLLHVPDGLRHEAYASIIEEPAVKKVLQLINNANIVVHGIGDANRMLKRRKTSFEDVEKVQLQHGVAEAFGYYFDEDGNIVHHTQTIGIQLEDLKSIPHVIAVAGGSSKAKAIASYFKRKDRQSVLITDEGAATALLRALP
ncbi:MAG: sugar-binding transcriptional regulator [Bacillaceae bacterium]